ncbi:hypothetical protein FHS31_002157 [Sphingomonas vulcanisoli]|uniref:DUF1838 domain-containing protein n=1 Tax=Sphingomonas vulcanisoli TaxID=1658060 RepID=A0ABX0TSP7_9SPHN|nr:hypothetical protein [Sphingomonas vulcanisoli]NIJ08536.1 hypothetical protein [Sphingomonas vulcanisoli]
MEMTLDRRRLLVGASGAAASLLLPAWSSAEAAPLTPERGLDSYRRMLCGAEGEEVLWWFIGDIYLQTPGASVVPVARSLTIGGYTAETSGPRTFRYRFREAGVIVDLATGEPLRRNPITQAPVAQPPLVDEKPEEIDWTVQDDGNIVKTQHGRTSTLNLRWTETSANLLLIETEPGPNAFALAPGDAGNAWKGLESTRTVYAKRADLARPGFVPADMIYSVAIKATPPWLATQPPADHWLIVRGIGRKSRKNEVVNQDALDLVRRFFPTYLP